MSGGSYDYLCRVLDVGELASKREQIERMRDRLRELGDAAAAAGNSELQHAYVYASRRTQFVLDGLKSAEGWARVLDTPWHAVEWLDSSDYGADTAAEEVLEWFRAPGEAWLPGPLPV